MIKKTFVCTLLAVFILVTASANNPGKPAATGKMPDNVKAIVDKSCFGCHNSDSKNDKAKEKFNFSTLESLDNVNKIKAFSEVGEIIEKDEMPPAKFLEKYPDHKLSESDKKILIEWAQAEAKALMKK